jgi:hypothetical protein
VLRRLVVLAATGLGIGLSLTVIAVSLVSPAYARDAEVGDGQPTPAPSVAPVAGDGAVAVTVAGVGSTVEDGLFTVARTQSVSPVCRYGPDMTGPEYYAYWKPGGVARTSGTLDAYAYQGLLYPNFQAYQDEMTGRWYGPVCRSDAPVDYKLAYWADHPAVYVYPADSVPSSRADVDPRQLAQIAYDFTDLPTGTIGWYPKAGGVDATIVNLDTWVWVGGAPNSVKVRASIPSGTWAEVVAVLDRVELSAPGAESAICDEPGIAWTGGATSTPCSIRFTHSSADQPVKDGQSLATSTLTVTAVWTASWTSSDNPTTSTVLPSQEIITTAEVPVAEIQTLVTGESWSRG